MKVFDATGHEVGTLMNRAMDSGAHEVTWDASEYPDGMYFCSVYAESLRTNDMYWKTIKMVRSR